MKGGILIWLLMWTCLVKLGAQQITFQKLFNAGTGAADLRTFDGRQTSDGGYITTGIGSFAGTERPFLQKLDCKGKVLWAKSFSASGSWNNIFMKVIETTDSHYVMVANTGTFQAYNILVAKFKRDGTAVWRKTINAGQGNDFGQSIKQTKDGGFIICGGTNSQGTEQVGSSYSDMYFVKISEAGVLQWSRTIGNSSSIDDAKDIVELQQGGYAFTGSYIHQQCFQVVLGSLDPTGNLQWIKTYGDTLSRSNGYALQQDSKGDLVLFATTTMRAPIPNFNGDVDHWLIKTNLAGDTLWSRAFNGTANDGSDNSLSMCINKSDNIILGTETMSYPSTGFTPNKQVSHKFNSAGTLLQSIGYNTTGSQYTRIQPAYDGGYTLTGFTTLASPASFRTNIFKLDSSLHSGCNETDLTALTDVGMAPFKISTPQYSIDSGATIGNNTYEASYALADTSLCEIYPVPNASFSVADSACVGSIVAIDGVVGSVLYSVAWGDGDSSSVGNPQATHYYTAAGSYTISFTASNGCDAATSTKIIIVTAPPDMQIVANPASAVYGESITLSANVVANNYAWSTNENTNTIQVQDSGWYWLQTMVQGCLLSDSISIQFNSPADTGYVYVPNVFSPNGDMINDKLVYFHSASYTLMSLHIFTRWGNEVFNTTALGDYWDGTYKGAALDGDTYFILIQFADKAKTITIKQDVILLR
jgi:gliding motility-associated-like protein